MPLLVPERGIPRAGGTRRNSRPAPHALKESLAGRHLLSLEGIAFAIAASVATSLLNGMAATFENGAVRCACLGMWTGMFCMCAGAASGSQRHHQDHHAEVK